MTRVVAKHHNPKRLTVTYMHTVAEMLEEIKSKYSKFTFNIFPRLESH